MKKTESLEASRKVGQLRRGYRVDVLADVESVSGKSKAWSATELDKLQRAILLVAKTMGGSRPFIHGLGGVTIQKMAMGSHGGEAIKHQVSLSTRGAFSSWTVVHELAHAWDANHDWKLSLALEKYTGGFTNRALSRILKLLGRWDAGPQGDEELPGRRGRRRGCNAAGYFYGDKPSGSNWAFNRKEDFAESVAMYIGWQNDNELSSWAEARLNRYLLENGAKDKNFGQDNWADYKQYFYPEDGNYSATKRWKFIDELVHGRLNVDS